MKDIDDFMAEEFCHDFFTGVYREELKRFSVQKDRSAEAVAKHLVKPLRLKKLG